MKIFKGKSPYGQALWITRSDDKIVPYLSLYTRPKPDLKHGNLLGFSIQALDFVVVGFGITAKSVLVCVMGCTAIFSWEL